MDKAPTVFALTIVDPTVFGLLDTRAKAGDKNAQAVLRSAIRTLQAIKTGTAFGPVLCACCRNSVMRPSGDFSVAVLVPAQADVTEGLGFTICGDCAREPADIREEAWKALRIVCPDARRIDVHPSFGRA